MNVDSCPDCSQHSLISLGAVTQVLLALMGLDNASSIPAGQPSLPEETQPLAELLMPWNAALLFLESQSGT